ncbi:MAG: hypothetical protein QF491_13175 [Alphaproteobacteria bacterium]|nr:hypothetical protein [Alphaproteobacteria bacterium]
MIPLPTAAARDAYLAGRERVTALLIRHGLIDSFFRFTSDGKPYPFGRANQLLPGDSRGWVEHRHHNTALLIMIDGALPRPLNKHFRLRASNRVSWRNIQRLAPDLDLSNFKAAHCRLDHPGFDELLPRLLSLDYALVAEDIADPEGPGPALTHMHVKLERLTDNAIKELSKELGYIERRLFERGEDYVEALEAKFFEYFGFSANAAGRKSAAAMAAQLLSGHDRRFSVFVAGQEDCRLTVLDEGEIITQYLLIRLADADLEAFVDSVALNGGKDSADYSVTGMADGPLPVLYRLRLRRTKAAQPGSGRRRDRDLLKPWLEIAEEAVLPRPGIAGPAIPFAWAETDDD